MGCGERSRLLSNFAAQHVEEEFKRAVFLLLEEVRVDALPIRKVMRQVAPLHDRARHVELTTSHREGTTGCGPTRLPRTNSSTSLHWASFKSESSALGQPSVG